VTAAAEVLAASWKNVPSSFWPGPPPARSERLRKMRNGVAFTVATVATAALSSSRTLALNVA
jgi:hypothetical protein